MQQEIWFQKYKILGLLGRGGTAKVYLAEHIKLNSYRAIKVISKQHPLYDLQRNEAFILKNLKHSCIPIIYDIEEDEEGSYIVEQYLEGTNLKDYVEEKGTVREDDIIRYGIQLCELIHYLHFADRPIIYVDLKPENIILAGKTLKLIDFGSAVYQDELSGLQSYSGTIGFAAPELCRRDIIDERCDVYGIGMLLYYMATGTRIGQNRTGLEHIDGSSCSVKLKDIINKCLKYQSSGRYASVAKLMKQLSTCNQKNQLYGCTDTSVRIAVAGAQRRIGTTHLAFRFCSYLNQRKLQCLYVERNDSGCVHAIKSCYEDIEYKAGICILEGVPMRSHTSRPADNGDYPFVLQDFGCLTQDNLADFLDADLKLLILGAKDWELGNSEHVLEMAAEYKDIYYLFNYLNGRQFRQVQKSMDFRNSYRIPYEPDPFESGTSGNDSALFEELLHLLVNRAFQEKAKL